MTRLLLLGALLSASSPVLAQDPEDGLVDARLGGDQSPYVAPVQRPQLVYRDRTTPVVIGAASAAIGGMSLVAAVAVYVARQNFRQRAWPALSSNVVDEWSTMGAVSLWLGVGASTLLVTSEYLLLPSALEPPTLMWFAGGAGVVLAAVGLGYAVGGEHCPPEVVRPGANLRLACTSGVADAIFGPGLLLLSAPLINLPLTYLLRKAFAGAPESLSLTPGGVQLRGRF